ILNYQIARSSIFQLYDRHPAATLFRRRRGKPRHLRMLLEKPGERTLQLAGAIPMNNPNDPLISQNGLVQKPLCPSDRFVDAASYYVQIGGSRFTWLQLHVDVHTRRGRRGADHAQIANAGTHPLAANVEVRRTVVY